MNIETKVMPVEEILKGFSKHLAACLEENQCSYEKLARETCSVKSSIGNYKACKSEAKIVALVRIAQYFNVSTDYMLGLTEVKATEPTLKSACEYVQLPDEAVKHLHGVDHEQHPLYRNIASHLISSGIFDEIVTQLENSLIAGRQYEILYGEDTDQRQTLLDTQQYKFNEQFSNLYKEVMEHLNKDLADQIELVTMQRWQDLQEAAQITIEKMEAILKELSPLAAAQVRQRINDANL